MVKFVSFIASNYIKNLTSLLYNVDNSAKVLKKKFQQYLDIKVVCQNFQSAFEMGVGLGGWGWRDITHENI
jgi:hypothetical protein